MTVLFKEVNLQPSTSPCNQVHAIHWQPDDICTALALRLPDLQSPSQEETDASQLAMGAVLKQGGHPILYHSETFSQSRIHEHQHIQWAPYPPPIHLTFQHKHGSLPPQAKWYLKPPWAETFDID
eukprot:Gb_37455 [translate_table: standard]